MHSMNKIVQRYSASVGNGFMEDTGAPNGRGLLMRDYQIERGCKRTRAL